MRFDPRTAARILAVSMLLLAAGCGLSDYEARIDAQRERIRLFDEENRLLGEAAEQPFYRQDDKQVPYWPADIFLRLPKGVSGSYTRLTKADGTPTGQTPYSYFNLPLFRYAGRDRENVFIAAGTVVEKNKENKYKEGEWPADLFITYLREALKEFYRQEYRSSYEPPFFTRFHRMVKKPLDERGGELPPLAFDALAFTDEHNRSLKDHSYFQVYLHREGDRQLAIVYQAPLSAMNDEAYKKTVDWSLKSLEVGRQASAKRAELLKRKDFRSKS